MQVRSHYRIHLRGPFCYTCTLVVLQLTHNWPKINEHNYDFEIPAVAKFIFNIHHIIPMNSFFLCRLYVEYAMLKWDRLLMITENDVNIFASVVFGKKTAHHKQSNHLSLYIYVYISYCMYTHLICFRQPISSWGIISGTADTAS